MKNLFKWAPAKTLAALLLTVTTAFCATASDIPNLANSANNLILVGEVPRVSSCRDTPLGKFCCTATRDGDSFNVDCGFQ
jgi:hypothetical protein